MIEISSKKKHPHIARPSVEQITGVLQSKTPVVRQLYLSTHLLVRHVKLRSLEQFEEKRSALSRLIKAASKLNK